ncbi:MAG: hypothetical protein R3335_02570 [Anaerolineales bacterium]|nr:hypothetical protein [Anaerolineales bacterium]
MTVNTTGLSPGAGRRKAVRTSPKISLYMIVLWLSALPGACSLARTWPAAGEVDPGFRRMGIEDVRVEVGVGSPIPVDILVTGTWPDLCAQLAEISQRVGANSIELTIMASPEDPGCPSDYLGLPFRIAIPLNTVGLAEGRYRIDVNGEAADFTWPIKGH